MKTKIEIERLWDEAIQSGKCLHRVVSLAGAISPCDNEKCEGFSAYDVDTDVYFCPNYVRIKKVVFE